MSSPTTSLPLTRFFIWIDISVFSLNYTTLPLYNIISCQLKLTKMRGELATLNHCAVPFLSRAATNLCWYYIILYTYHYSPPSISVYWTIIPIPCNRYIVYCVFFVAYVHCTLHSVQYKLNNLYINLACAVCILLVITDVYSIFICT